jgi:xanthine dehydrogenase YagR molybdenum-binding subunit
MATANLPHAANIIGAAVPRIDGPLKTIGTARYAVDYDFPGLAHAVAVQSTIASGRIRRLDVSAAEGMPGMLLIFHHGNMDKVYRLFPHQDDANMSEARPPFEDDKIYYWGKYIAVVVAETLELRIKNDADRDEGTNLPFSSRHLKECFTAGAEKICWKQHTPEPGSMRRNGKIIGWGLAGASWGAARIACSATVELCPNGRICVRCATQGIGTGTYTIFAQVMHAKTGVALDHIDVFLGDSSLPDGPMSGGSMTTSAILPAANNAVNSAIARLLNIATLTPNSPLFGAKPDTLTLSGGRIRTKEQEQAGMHGVAFNADDTPASRPPASGVPFEEVISLARLSGITATGRTFPSFEDPKAKAYSMHSFGAHFAEVEWEPEIARLRVSRIFSIFDCGRIINLKAGTNQILGAAVMGVGMTLLEETHYEARSGQPINGTFADYLVPTCADLPELDVTFLDYPDPIVNEYGARGVGEIGMAGMAPAITAAVYHATGVRVRELPVRIEDLLKSKVMDA